MVAGQDACNHQHLSAYPEKMDGLMDAGAMGQTVGNFLDV
jgi:hypothetical protein